MVKIEDKLNYFELEELVKSRGYDIPTSDYIILNKEKIPYTKVWVSDTLDTDEIDIKHYAYDISESKLVPTYNLYKINSVAIQKEINHREV